MYSPNFFEQFLGFGSVAELLSFSVSELDAMGLDPAPLASLGLLTETRIGSSVECAGCGFSVPVSPRTVDDGIALCADCPACGVYRLSPLETKRYQMDFSPLLATGKTPLLLVLGSAPRPENLGTFSPDRVFLFSDLTVIADGKIHFDASIIQAQLGTLPALAEPARKTVGRNSKIGDLIIKLKAELREYMRGNYSAVMQAERHNRMYDFPEIKQSDLARMLGVERVYIKRALDTDLELKTLFASANNRNSTLAYGHRANF